MRRVWRGFIFLILPLGLVACSPVKMPPVATYTISSLHSLSIPATSKTHQILLISMPEAAPGYNSSQMMYVNVPYKLRAFARHAWVAPPAEMLLPLLAQRLGAQGYFKAVVTPPFSGIANYRLDTQLLVLEQDFLEPTSRVRLAMQATLLSSSGQVIASRRFRASIEAPGNDPYSGVVAVNQAAAQVTQQIAGFVVQEVRR